MGKRSSETQIARIRDDVISLLTENESVERIAHQNRTAFGQRPDAAVATNNRIIIYRKARLGKLSFEDFLWEDVRNAKLEEGRFSSTLGFETGDRYCKLGNVDKDQARALYTFCQQKEQEWRERRRIRKIEEDRAKAGGVQINAPTPGGAAIADSASGSTAKLTEAKRLLDQSLITEAEYEEIRARILSSF